MISTDAYAEFLTAEYLDTYIADGGAAVQFVVVAESVGAERFGATMRARAAASGYARVRARVRVGVGRRDAFDDKFAAARLAMS